MQLRPSRRLRLLAGASVLTTALVFAFSSSSIASADTTPPSMPSMFEGTMRFVESVSRQLTSLEATVASFAESFTTNKLTFTRGTGNEIDVQTLCVGSTCVTPTKFQAMVAAANQAGNSPTPPLNSDADASTTPDTPPVIQINGDNPAIIQVGDSYADLGATITGPQADLNLGITTYVNGTETIPVQIDTSTAATDTIDYVVTDSQGLTATSTRTVIVEASSIVPTDDASTSQATSTSP